MDTSESLKNKVCNCKALKLIPHDLIEEPNINKIKLLLSFRIILFDKLL